MAVSNYSLVAAPAIEITKFYTDSLFDLISFLAISVIYLQYYSSDSGINI